MLEKYETHIQIFSLATLNTMFAQVPKITQQGKVSASVTHSSCYPLRRLLTHRQAQCDVQNSPSSAQDLQRAVPFDATLSVWTELVFLAAVGVSATLGH